MNTRRFVLRLAVAVITFLIGWTAATLFGATRRQHDAPTPVRRVVVVRNYEVAPPRFEHSPLPPCGSDAMRHAFAWREMHADEFDAPAPPPPSSR
ncbi:MAG: hypothetical protein QOF61_436 [Acidobacteriota bacterium]|jgi:hypothetical protein|nr:hypothetical protein [Acidobacteriota bacterium]